MRKKYNSLRARAKKRNLPVTMSYELYCRLKMSDCYYCGISNLLLQFYCNIMKIRTPWMSIDRADNTQGYVFNNVVPCCFLCNKIKGSFFSLEEMKKIGKEFVAPKFKVFEEEAFEEFEEWCENNTITADDEEFLEELNIDQEY